MFETFKTLSLEQKNAFIMQYLIIASMGFMLIPQIGVYLMIGSILIEIFGSQAYIYKTKFENINRHMGERYFDSFLIREKSYAQDMVISMKMNAIPLELFTESTQTLFENSQYKQKEALVIRLRAQAQAPQLDDKPKLPDPKEKDSTKEKKEKEKEKDKPMAEKMDKQPGKTAVKEKDAKEAAAP